MKLLTDIQINTVSFIERFSRENGYPPTIREVAKAFEISGPAAFDRLVALKKKGLLDWRDGQSRTIRILKKGA